jgi:hypothetical protein
MAAKAVGRKPYRENFFKQLAKKENEDFLLEKIKKEWNEMERSKKRKEFFDRTKATGKEIGKILLGLSLVAGGLVIVAVAPGVLSIVDALGKYAYYFDEEKLNTELRHLKHKKLAVVTGERNEIRKVKSTKLGDRYVFRDTFINYKTEEQAVWDGYWRIVIFDVPNKLSKLRDGFRWRLKEFGFYQFQKSIFVFPYECEKDINFFSSVFNVYDFVHVLKAGRFDGDMDIIKFFNLT